MIPSNIPLPTDNLYKFVALSGVVLIAVSVFFYFSKTHEVQLAAHAASEQNSILELQAEKFHRAADRVEFLTGLLESSRKSALEDRSEEKNDRYRSNFEEFSSEYEKFQEVAEKYEVEAIRFSANGRRFDDLIEFSVTVRIICRNAMVIGFGMMIWGFVMWYRRVQIFLDLILTAKTVEGVHQMNEISSDRK